jgi:Copper transport outer membrane protein, MctB
MGYSARYHAASLAAVFLALAVGILVGVGFASDLVNGTADDLERSLHSAIDEKDAQIDDLEADLATEQKFSAAVAPAVVENRLRESQIAIVAFGGLDDALADDIRNSLEPAGAVLREIAVVREPPDMGAINSVLPRRRSHGETREDQLTRAATLAGQALVAGGGRFDDLRSALFTRYSGDPGGIDGVVIVRQQPADMGDRDASNSTLIEDGMIDGMQNALPDVPGIEQATVVGAEQTTSDPSSIGFFTDHGASSVDNVDQLPGKVALVYALDGAEGDFGVKDTADALLPDLLAPATAAGSLSGGQGG